MHTLSIARHAACLFHFYQNVFMAQIIYEIVVDFHVFFIGYFQAISIQSLYIVTQDNIIRTSNHVFQTNIMWLNACLLNARDYFPSFWIQERWKNNKLAEICKQWMPHHHAVRLATPWFHLFWPNQQFNG